MKKIKYLVKWKSAEVGIVYTNAQNEFMYEPNLESIRECALRGMPCINIMIPQRKWSKQLPEFIENNINGNALYNCNGEKEVFEIIPHNNN